MITITLNTSHYRPPVICEGCGCMMAMIPPPEFIAEMAPQILCGSCLAKRNTIKGALESIRKTEKQEGTVEA